MFIKVSVLVPDKSMSEGSLLGGEAGVLVLGFLFVKFDVPVLLFICWLTSSSSTGVELNY